MMETVKEILVAETELVLPQNLSPEEFLLFCEKNWQYKFEYNEGEIRMMGKTSLQHAQIQANTLGGFINCLKSKGCRILGSDYSVKIQKKNGKESYFLPDLVVVCGEGRYSLSNPPDLLNPTVVVEILSESTDYYDRTDKFDVYTELDSLQQYVLIDSRSVHVEVWSPFDNRRDWKAIRKNQLDDEIEIAGCKVKLAAIYDWVEW